MRRTPHAAALLAVVAALALAGPAHAQRPGVHNPVDKLEVCFVRMAPQGVDASNFSRAGYGGGIEATLPLPSAYRLVAGTGGLEVVNLLSWSHEFHDPTTGMRYLHTYGLPQQFGNGAITIHPG